MLEGELCMATRLDSDDEQEVQAFFQQAFEAGCEGIMVGETARG